jgi:hypothetical protein
VFDLIVTIAGILLLAKVYPEAKYPSPGIVYEPKPALTEPSAQAL